MNLILFGFKASGKTHFAKLLARELKKQFIDTDEIIMKRYKSKGKSIQEIYTLENEARFRALEKEAIESLKNVDNAVIALGAGAVILEENRTLLSKLGPMVYLKCDPQVIKARILKNSLPAFLDPDDIDGSFQAMIQERTPIYESIPARVIETDQLDEAGVLAALHSIVILEEPPNGF